MERLCKSYVEQAAALKTGIDSGAQVPHLTDAVQDWIERVARTPVDDTSEEPDVCIIELGGTGKMS